MGEQRAHDVAVERVGKVGAFFILGFFGREVYRRAPPIPAEVRAADGRLLMTRDDILTGQMVWQSTGGQQLGSIWGHGSYQAPDWRRPTG